MGYELVTCVFYVRWVGFLHGVLDHCYDNELLALPCALLEISVFIVFRDVHGLLKRAHQELCVNGHDGNHRYRFSIGGFHQHTPAGVQAFILTKVPGIALFTGKLIRKHRRERVFASPDSSILSSHLS